MQRCARIAQARIQRANSCSYSRCTSRSKDLTLYTDNVINEIARNKLKNSPLTNAGLGSNLTLDGKIECDASIMDGNGFGSVGAVSNIKNPIMIALSLLESQIKGTLSMGRIVPW